jgi:tetratricopeptide (TPR) repeat protein
MSTDLAIVSAADSAFFAFLQDLVGSVRDRPEGRTVPFYVIDAGLAPTERATLAGRGVTVVEPAWPYPVEAKGPQRALALRCRIPELFPGHGIYLWIDADVWVQDWSAVELFAAAAAGRGLALVAEVDRSFDLTTWAFEQCRRLYGPGLARHLWGKPLLNAGVFAARADAPHWAAWRQRVEEVLVATAADFDLDQTALNIVAHLDGPPAALLPPRCNWICHRALPWTSADGQTLLDPEPPHRPLGMVHMTAMTKRQPALVLQAIDGGLKARSLRYGAMVVDAHKAGTPEAVTLARAWGWSMTGFHHKARRVLRQLVAEMPERPDGWTELARSAERLGDLPDAARAWRRSLALDPGPAAHHGRLGALYLRQGRVDEAAAALQQALLRSPGDAEIARQLQAAEAERPLPLGDYVSPGMRRVRAERHFPDIERVAPAPGRPHAAFVSRREPAASLPTCDEAHILFNAALGLDGRTGLEIGASTGFAACHLALGGLRLDLIDPMLADAELLGRVSDALLAAGVVDSCRLLAVGDPGEVARLAAREGTRWSLLHIGAGAPAPEAFAAAAEPLLQPDAVAYVGGLAAPEAGAALAFFRRRGWRTRILRTAGLMGVAWRGGAAPVAHVSDPALPSALPGHLVGWTEVAVL